MSEPILTQKQYTKHYNLEHIMTTPQFVEQASSQPTAQGQKTSRNNAFPATESGIPLQITISD